MTKHSIMILLDLLDPRSWSKVKLEVYNIFQEHPGTRKCVRNVLELGNRREHQSAPFPFTFQSYTWLSYPTIRSPSFASNREAYNEKSEAAKGHITISTTLMLRSLTSERFLLHYIPPRRLYFADKDLSLSGHSPFLNVVEYPSRFCRRYGSPRTLQKSSEMSKQGPELAVRVLHSCKRRCERVRGGA